MDYEFRIKQVEVELAHLREMQALHSARLDAHGRSIEAVEIWFERVMETIKRTTANLDLLTIQQGGRDSRFDDLEAKIDRLVEALLGSRNGGQGGKA